MKITTREAVDSTNLSCGVGLLTPASSPAKDPCGLRLAQGWPYLQSEVGSGERHLGEADGPLDVMVTPEDGNALC